MGVLPPLVFAGESRELTERLAAVANGELTEKEAIAKYKEAAAGAAGKKPKAGKSGFQKLGPAALVAKLTYKGVRGKDYIVVFEVPSKDGEEESKIVFVGERFRKQFAGTKVGALTSPAMPSRERKALNG